MLCNLWCRIRSTRPITKVRLATAIPMQGGFASGLQGQVGQNNYVNALAGDMMSDANKIKMQNLGGIDARAPAAAGMSGSTGYH